MRDLSPLKLIVLLGSLAILPLVGWLVVSFRLGLVELVVGLILLALLFFRYPEYLLVLYILSGFYKKAPLLQVIEIYIDITLFLGILVVACIGYGFLVQRRVFPRIGKSFALPLGVIVLFTVGGLVYTPSLVYGVEKALRFLTLGLLAIVAPLLIIRSKDSLARVFPAMSAIALWVVTDSLLTGQRGAFADVYTVVGKLGGLHVLLAMQYFGRRTKGAVRVVILMSAIYALLGVLQSATRAPFLALLVLAPVVFLFNVTNLRVGWVRFAPVLVLAAVVIAFYFFPEFVGTMAWRLAVISDNPRLEIWRASIDAIVENPILGGGTGSFYVYLQDYFPGIGERVFSHNIFVEVWAELGIFAVASLVYIFVYLLRRLYRLRVESAIPKQMQDYVLFDTLFTVLLYVFLLSMVGGILYDRFIFGWLGIGFAALNTVNDSPDKDSGRQVLSSIA